MKEHKPPLSFTSLDPSSSGFRITILKATDEPKPKSLNAHPATTGRRARKKQTGDKINKQPPPVLIPENDEPGALRDPAESSAPTVLRLFLKKGEYVYARPMDIVLVESCDHLVKVYIACDQKIIRAVRNSTLKDFLLKLPSQQFLRIGRFCAVNLHRISGGNYQQQLFEFDFRVSVRLKHTLPITVFKSIGK